jgi:hypothetical protein
VTMSAPPRAGPACPRRDRGLVTRVFRRAAHADPNPLRDGHFEPERQPTAAAPRDAAACSIRSATSAGYETIATWHPDATSGRASYATRWAAVIARFTRCRSRTDLSEFEQFEPERLDLREDPEQRGPILEQAGEHGVPAFQLRHHRGKGGEGGSSEPALNPDRVQARQCGHWVMLQPDLVSPRRRNLVIVRMPVLALLR